MSKKLTYDVAFKELSGILNELQSDETGLDVLAEKLKRAAELSNFCKDKLREVETTIDTITNEE